MQTDTAPQAATGRPKQVKAAGAAAHRRGGAQFQRLLQQDAAPLSRKQKLHLAWRTATDPVAFGIAGFDAGLSQAENDFPGYGQGAQGYAKRFGASYADNFDGTMLGNAIFPILLKQDPRYFRRGQGKFHLPSFLFSFDHRLVQERQRKWGPNYSNMLGNLAAGGISNLYYPASDRGAGLTFERGFTVTAYGAFGGVFNEFWPDIARKIFKDKMAKLQPTFRRPPYRPQPQRPLATQ